MDHPKSAGDPSRLSPNDMNVRDSDIAEANPVLLDSDGNPISDDDLLQQLGGAKPVEVVLIADILSGKKSIW